MDQVSGSRYVVYKVSDVSRGEVWMFVAVVCCVITDFHISALVFVCSKSGYYSLNSSPVVGLYSILLGNTSHLRSSWVWSSCHWVHSLSLDYLCMCMCVCGVHLHMFLVLYLHACCITITLVWWDQELSGQLTLSFSALRHETCNHNISP